MTITLFTVFPHYFDSSLNESMLKRAQESGKVDIQVIDIREYTQDKHRMTDDRPFGGGAGMVMKIEPIDRAIQAWVEAHPEDNKYIIATSAAGKSFNQAKAREYSTIDHLAILCGHYEGIDERVFEHLIDEEVRVGDYVLTGGEPAALIIVDAVTRLIPGVLGNVESTNGESHELPGQGRIPQYTRPTTYKSWTVPDILLSGDHQAINQWREKQRTKIVKD